MDETFTRQIIPSDKSVKTDIKDLDGDKSIEFISKLQPKSFLYNKVKHVGFIAQELEDINPYCVVGNVAKEKNKDSPPILSVCYTDIFVHNTNAVKHLIQYIDMLYLKIQNLEKRLEGGGYSDPGTDDSMSL